jgi:hypothetical protein
MTARLVIILCFGLPIIAVVYAYDKAVYQSQEMLKELGYKPGPLNGIWGSMVEKAVRDFQRANKLPETGKLDEKTKTNIIVRYEYDKNFKDGTTLLTLTSEEEILQKGPEPSIIMQMPRRPLQFSEGALIKIIGLLPGQFIEINGLKAEEGVIKIVGQTPKFVENGVMVVDKFCQKQEQPVNVRIGVKVLKDKEADKYLWKASFLYDEKIFDDLICHSDIDGKPLQLTFKRQNKSGYHIAFNDPGVVSFKVVRIPGDTGKSELVSASFSQNEYPPGFRFATADTSEVGTRFFGFLDKDLVRGR